jgi:HK97 family phage portal protein
MSAIASYAYGPRGFFKAATPPNKDREVDSPLESERYADNQADEGPDTAPGGDRVDTPEGEPPPDEPSGKSPQTLFWDPFAIVEQLGYRDRPSLITYATLKAMAWRVPVVRAIIQTRLNQIGAFCQPQRDRYHLGYRIRTRDSEHEPTPADKRWIKQMESVLQRTGVTENPRGRDSFESFIRKVMLDSLVYDQMCFEVVPDKRGRPCEWYAVDAATVRLADSASVYLHTNLDKAVRYVQIYDGMIITEYTQDEMAFCVRNPSTDIRLFGYGTSELEMMVDAVTSFLYAWEYNRRFFSQGSSAKGLINIKGALPEKQLKAFRRHWYTMISGVENAWRTPILNAEDVQWLNMQNSNREMEFSAYMDFIIKILCSIFSIDPIEVNFQYGNTGQRSAMNTPSNREKITESKERGLRPLIRFLSGVINRHIIWPTNEAFEFEFVGLDSMTREQWTDVNVKRVSNFRTIDEIRAEDDYPPLPEGKGECILNPTWVQWASQKDQAAQQGAMGMLGGMAGPPGAPGVDEGAPQGQEQPPEQVFDEQQMAQQLDQGAQEQQQPQQPGQPMTKAYGPRRIVVDLDL